MGIFGSKSRGKKGLQNQNQSSTPVATSESSDPERGLPETGIVPSGSQVCRTSLSRLLLPQINRIFGEIRNRPLPRIRSKKEPKGGGWDLGTLDNLLLCDLAKFKFSVPGLGCQLYMKVNGIRGLGSLVLTSLDVQFTTRAIRLVIGLVAREPLTGSITTWISESDPCSFLSRAALQAALVCSDAPVTIGSDSRPARLDAVIELPVQCGNTSAPTDPTILVETLRLDLGHLRMDCSALGAGKLLPSAAMDRIVHTLSEKLSKALRNLAQEVLVEQWMPGTE